MGEIGGELVYKFGFIIKGEGSCFKGLGKGEKGVAGLRESRGQVGKNKTFH